MANHKSIVETRELTKHYGRLPALNDCTLSVGRGEVFGLLGPNGSGKTTLLRLLMGFSATHARRRHHRWSRLLSRQRRRSRRRILFARRCAAGSRNDRPRRADIFRPPSRRTVRDSQRRARRASRTRSVAPRLSVIDGNAAKAGPCRSSGGRRAAADSRRTHIEFGPIRSHHDSGHQFAKRNRPGARSSSPRTSCPRLSRFVTAL